MLSLHLFREGQRLLSIDESVRRDLFSEPKEFCRASDDPSRGIGIAVDEFNEALSIR